MAADELFIYRGIDTSPGGGKYYWLRDNPLATLSRWCPRRWAVGGVYERNPLVSFYYKANCAKAAEPKEGYWRTWLRLAARHETYTFPGGLTLPDVIELHWLLTATAAEPSERYWYARGYGLVGWQSGAGPMSYIIAEHPAGQRPDNKREVIGCLK